MSPSKTSLRKLVAANPSSSMLPASFSFKYFLRTSALIIRPLSSRRTLSSPLRGAGDRAACAWLPAAAPAAEYPTLKEVARYTRAANQERLATDAIERLAEQKLLKRLLHGRTVSR